MGDNYGITFVDDDALPEGHDFMFVALAGGGCHIFYRESRLSPQSLEDSWAAYRALLASGVPGPGEAAMPEQRAPRLLQAVI